MKKILITLIILLSAINLFASLNNTKGLQGYYDSQVDIKDEVVKAKVLEVIYDNTKEFRPNVPIESDFRLQHLKVELTNSNHKGEVFTIQNQISMIMPYKLILSEGDKILLYINEDNTGKVKSLIVYDRDRSLVIYTSIFLFILFLLLIGRMQGFKSLIGLVVTISLILLVFIPLIIGGYDPLISSLLVCIVATVVTLLLIAGLNYKSISAIIGTICGTIIAMIFSIMAGHFAKLTGLGNEQAQLLAFIPSQRHINYQSLLFAGIAIGALGAVMDTALSISSSMSELIITNNNITKKQLRKSGMNIGRDIIGSMSNTLVLAYVSTSIPLILIFMLFNTSMLQVMNLDVISSEILRAIAGSIGLIFTIPITVLISSFLHRNKK